MTELLYSNRELETVYIDIECHNPLFVPKADGKSDWFWLVDLTFLAWAYRVVTRAKEAGSLTDDERARFAILRTYGRERFGSQCDGVPATAAKPVPLPPIPAEFFREGFRASVGTGTWSGMEKDAARWEESEPEPAEQEQEQVETTKRQPVGQAHAASKIASTVSKQNKASKPVKVFGPSLF